MTERNEKPKKKVLPCDLEGCRGNGTLVTEHMNPTNQKTVWNYSRCPNCFEAAENA